MGLVSATATIGDVETFSTAGSLTKHAPEIPVSRGSKSAGKVRCTKTKRKGKNGKEGKNVYTPRDAIGFNDEFITFKHRWLLKCLQAGSLLSVLHRSFSDSRKSSKKKKKTLLLPVHALIITLKSSFLDSSMRNLESQDNSAISMSWSQTCPVFVPVGRAAAVLSRCAMSAEGAGGDNK